MACAAASTGCASEPSGSSSGSITVFAASSLTAAFQEIGAAFTTTHPGSDITFNFAGSSELVAQIVEGAPAHVFASADRANMERLTEADGTASDPVVFATNTMAIIVEAGNPSGIASLADLARSDLSVVLCSGEVPCGKYADDVLAKADVEVTPKSLEQNAKSAVSKVVTGEADAAIVFATDVVAAGGSASGIDIPVEQNVTAQYPIAVTARAAGNVTAVAFVEFVRSDAGQQILQRHGFSAP